jgi:hypothetical protein
MLVWPIKSLAREGSSLFGCQAFLWRSQHPYGPTHRDCQAGAQSPWIDAAWSNHPRWDGVEFTLSLSRGEETIEVVHLALVEKVQVLVGRFVSTIHVKGEKPFSPDLKSLESGVREPSLQRAHDARGYTLPEPRAVWPHAVWPLRSPATTTIAQHTGSPRVSCDAVRS